MFAIEFQTKINNGSIELPQEFIGKLVGEVRVIVLKHEQAEVEENLIDRLLAKPISLDSFKPMSREEIHART